MNIQVPPSPASTASSDWPGPQKYRNYNQPRFPASQGRRSLATPPTSGSSFGTAGNMANGLNGRPGDYRNPSPPSSVTARSSNGSSQNEAAQKRKQSVMEESLYQHYRVLQKYLATTQRDEAAEGKPNRARDKLVRLSPIQFQELSTDVYDELQRRQAYARQPTPNSPGAPDFLLPREGFHPKRNQARQKLSTLPPARFRALATDVFYELERRVPRFAGGDLGRVGSPANGFRGPSSRSATPNGVRPGSRDQTRRPPPRQGSLGGSTMNGSTYGQDGVNGPMQKSSQSNTIVPNKSYLVEDDDEPDGESLYGLRKRDTSNTQRSFGANEKIITDYQNKVEDLQGKISDLEKQVEEKNVTIDSLELNGQSRDREASEASEGWSTLRMGLEAKLAEAVALNNSLQSEIDKAKDMHAERERCFQDQLDIMAGKSGADSELSGRYKGLLEENGSLQRDSESLRQEKDSQQHENESLQQENESLRQDNESLRQENQELQQDSQELQQELLEQQRVTDEVRREAAGFLSEMKALSQTGSGNQDREEELMQQVQSLEDQIAMWKTRFAQSKAATRSEALDLAIEPAKVGKDDLHLQPLLQPDGLIKDVHVIEFQVAIDEALRISRVDPKGLLNQMKSVILTIKHISDDFTDVDRSDPRIAKLLTKISGTACNFITATKNYVYAGGLSPVSLLDAAASHLSAAVVDAVHKVRMYPFQDSTVRESTSIPGGRSGASDSIYGTATVTAASEAGPQAGPVSSRAALTNGSPKSAPTYDSAEQAQNFANLKIFLEDQTSTLIETIQHLVSAIRSSAEPPAVRSDVSAINTSITAVLRATQTAVDSIAAGSPRRDAVSEAVRALAGSKARLLEAEDAGWGSRDYESWREVANGLPPIAFEIAREVRELGGKVEALVKEGKARDGDGEGEDFS